jgi:hypothetical protein
VLSKTARGVEAELAYCSRNENGEWGLALKEAQSTMVDIIGMNFIPMYKVVCLILFFVSPLLMVLIKIPADHHSLPVILHHIKIQRMLMLHLDACCILEVFKINHMRNLHCAFILGPLACLRAIRKGE